MALTPSFTINAIPPISPSVIALADTSTGSDVSIISRQVLIYTIDNALYTPAVPWALADASIDIDVLQQDAALSVNVQWLNSGGGVVEQDTQIFAFREYSEQFYYQLTQAQTSQPTISADSDYYNNKIKLRVNIDDAVNAIDTGEDIYGAEGALERAIYMCQQHQLFFNV